MSPAVLDETALFNFTEIAFDGLWQFLFAIQGCISLNFSVKDHMMQSHRSCFYWFGYKMRPTMGSSWHRFAFAINSSHRAHHSA